MSETAPDLDPDEETEDDEIHPAILSARRDLERLEELTIIGMKVARRIYPMSEDEAADQALKGEHDPNLVPLAQMAQVLTAVSRSIRLTMTLKAKIHADLRELETDVDEEEEDCEEDPWAATQRASQARLRAADEAQEVKRSRIRELVIEAAESEIEDPREMNSLVVELDCYIRKELSMSYHIEQPTRDIVARLCDALHLKKVDWSRWDGEGWIKADSPRAASAARPAERSSDNGYGASDDSLPTARFPDNRPAAPPRLE